jgi:hypothetical protein
MKKYFLHSLILICAAAGSAFGLSPAVNLVEAVVARQLDAYNRQDIEAFVACFAPDVRIERDGSAEVQVGRDGMRQRYGDMFKRFPHNRATVLKRIVVGQHAVDEELVEGRDGRPFRTIAVYTVKDALITHVRFLSREDVVP